MSETLLHIGENEMPYATGAEIQSGHDRQLWAEHLILQLPKNHDGRNSWLMSFGREDEAQALRKERGISFYTLSQAAMPPAETVRKSDCHRYNDCETGICECHCLNDFVVDSVQRTIDADSRSSEVDNGASTVTATEGQGK
jgi:hypothetical protein